MSTVDPVGKCYCEEAAPPIPTSADINVTFVGAGGDIDIRLEREGDIVYAYHDGLGTFQWQAGGDTYYYTLPQVIPTDFLPTNEIHSFYVSVVDPSGAGRMLRMTFDNAGKVGICWFGDSGTPTSATTFTLDHFSTSYRPLN